MPKYGLIGYPLDHSFSAAYFTSKFQRESLNDCTYQLFPIEKIDRLPLLLENENLSGFNVTIPYKESVISFLHQLDPIATMIGAVNCVKCGFADGKPFLTGYNTDAVGFENTLLPLIKGKKVQALILGNGGSAKTVKFVLDKLGIRNLIVSRSTTMFGYVNIDEAIMQSYPLIINTTPLGMHPNLNDAPDIPYNYITNNHIFYDLIYNPPKSKFLTLAEANGATIVNGQSMLEIQADESWKIWNT